MADEERERGTEDVIDDDVEERQPFIHVVGRAVAVLRSAGKFDEAEEFEYGINAVSDLQGEDGKQLLHALRTTRGYGSQVANDLLKHVTAEQERLDALQRQAEADDREERKRTLLAKQEEAAREEAQKKRDQELLDEIEREKAESAAKAAAGGKPTGPDLDEVVSKRITGILQEVEEIRKTPGGPEFEQKVQALELAIGPAKALADAMSDPRRMAAERADSWAQADPETRELAGQMYGVAGVFDIDPDSPEYRNGLEAAKKEAAETEAWVAEQTASGRS